MILTSMPDLPPRPLTAENAAFRRRFYERWGRQNALVCGLSTRAEYLPIAQRLSVKAAWGGSERYFLPEREVAVDDDHWLVLNDGRLYGSRIHARQPVRSCALFFRYGAAGAAQAARRQTATHVLDDPAPTAHDVGFHEHLRPHDGGAVSRRLRLLQSCAMTGQRDDLWLDVQAKLLLGELLATAGPLDPCAAHTRRSVRDETARRLHRAADYIDANHAEPLTLDDMARVACLSRFHFVRLFKRHFGRTPYAFLVHKRARAARRALDAGAHDREAVALACGFGSRSALTRALQRLAATPRLSHTK